jgi:diguanylate cyclase (GGDEF)-like protein/PAS domain S-box-containing protein
MNKQRQHSNAPGKKLKQWILLPLTLVFCLSLAAFSVFIYHNERAHLDESFGHELATMQASYQGMLALHGEYLRTAFGFLEHDRTLRAALAAGDRTQLQTRFAPLFEKLKRELNITHFYFLDANRVTLLRLHQPSRFGDRIERVTAREAERTGRLAIGVELGPLGTLTLRAVMPLREGGHTIGYVELGVETLDIVHDISRDFGNDAYVLLHKKHLSRQKWEEGMRMLGRKPEWDNYSDIILDSQTRPDIPPELDRIFAQGESAHKLTEIEVKQNGQTYRLGFIPLLDASDRDIGDIAVLRNTTATTTQTRKLLFMLTGMVIVCGVLLFLMIYLILDRTQRALATHFAERKQAEAELRIAAKAFESQESMFITDANEIIQRVNKAFTETTGYSAEEAVGQKPSILKSGRHDAEFYRALRESLGRDGFWQGEIWNRRKNGEIYPEWEAITVVRGADGQITHYISAFTDISKRKEAEEQIRDLAFYDPLTKLPNRRLLLDRLHQAIVLSVRNSQQGALLFIDLDNFKSVNDTQGHAVGDLLLVEVANRLQSCIRAGDTTARLGGDEFVVLLEGLDPDEPTAASQAETVGEKIRETIEQPFLINGKEYNNTTSIGITLFRGPIKTMEEMLKRADVALYQAKADGRNTVRFFDPALQTIVMARVTMEADLRRAVSTQDQFQLYYQAQVDSSGHLNGAEALVRWLHPERGMLSPTEFIPLAEETGLIMPLGNWVLKTACQQLAAWATQPETSHLTLAVNVSAKQFRLATFVEEVCAVVDLFKVDPAKLKLEITESLLLDNVDDIIAKMTALKARGISFSIDDFGTGYSSLSYLKRLPLYQLKIDQSFVRDVLTDPNDATIAKIIVSLAYSMNLAVIAEGVETEAQREFLDLNGCHSFQGYLFSKPIPIKEFEQLVAKYA